MSTRRALCSSILLFLSAQAFVTGCHKRTSGAPEPEKVTEAPKITTVTQRPTRGAVALEQVHGKLSPAQLERISVELELVQPEKERVIRLVACLSDAYLSVSQLAELIELFELEPARLEAIEQLSGRLIEGAEGEERHVLLDLFEDPALRARAVDLLGWH